MAESRSDERPTFPDGFRSGAATAAHQIEGAGTPRGPAGRPGNPAGGEG
jgi:hypothetical protein